MTVNLQQTYTNIRRRLFVFSSKFFSNQDYRAKRPKKMSLSEEQAVRIWTKVVHQPESNLMYNPQSHEAYAEWDSPSGTVYLFLESSNLRVINTVVGYDIRLSQKVEQWCSSVFTREVSKRRKKFKRLAESKVVHSLDSLENRLQFPD